MNNIHYQLGKAGRKRWLGKRPQSRGSVMNLTINPHGGGEGKAQWSSQPMTPWGKKAHGIKTRDTRRLREVNHSSP